MVWLLYLSVIEFFSLAFAFHTNQADLEYADMQRFQIKGMSPSDQQGGVVNLQETRRKIGCEGMGHLQLNSIPDEQSNIYLRTENNQNFNNELTNEIDSSSIYYQLKSAVALMDGNDILRMLSRMIFCYRQDIGSSNIFLPEILIRCYGKTNDRVTKQKLAILFNELPLAEITTNLLALLGSVEPASVAYHTAQNIFVLFKQILHKNYLSSTYARKKKDDLFIKVTKTGTSHHTSSKLQKPKEHCVPMSVLRNMFERPPNMA